MIVWMFYIKHRGFDTTSLYAYTNDKKVAKEFREQRKSKFIYMFKREGFSKEAWDELNLKFGKLKIIEGHFYTKNEDGDGKKPVTVLCTMKEEESVYLYADSLWLDPPQLFIDPRAFKKKYLVALETLLYMKFYCFYAIKRVQNADYFYEPYYSNFHNEGSFIYEEFKEHFYDYDELRIFLKLYKHTFTDEVEDEG